MANIFGQVDDVDSEVHNMYLNAAGIVDDINGLMDCHRLDLPSTDDCCNVLLEPKEEDPEEEGLLQPKIEIDNDIDQDMGDVHLHHHIEPKPEVDDDDSSLNATIPGLTTITGGGHDGPLMDDEDDDDLEIVQDYKPHLIVIGDDDLLNGGIEDIGHHGVGSNGLDNRNCVGGGGVDDGGGGGGGGEITSAADVRELYANTSLDAVEPPEEDIKPLQHETMCQLCATVFKTRYNLLRHFQKRHPEYKLYECDLCRISFPGVEDLKDHMDENHSKGHPANAIDNNQVRFACDVCGNMYKNKASAMNHLLTHTAKKTVRCEHCDFTCYTKQQLGVHQTKHDKRFVCDICHKRFAQKSQLDVHVNAVHYNQRPYACVLCKKTFKTKGSHDAHMIVHTDTRNYQCPHCDKKCRKRYDLTLHIRTHTGEKPFKCSVCGRGFVQMCDTRKHEMLHFKPGKRKSFFFSSQEDDEENAIDDE